MFKWYAEFFKLTEKQMTRKALNRLKLITFAALPAAPLLILETFGAFPDISKGIKLAIFLIPATALFIVSFSKFANRFLMPNKFLDEWEVARKQEAMAFSYQCLIYSAMAVMLFFMVFSHFDKTGGIEFRSINFVETAMALFGIFTLLLYIVHIYLLFTVNPIDERNDEDASVIGN